ncbi:hypothetical protein [Acholeplasma equifetale]|uniref:hypothetical protein n=1 Tax=Acholeplasma equifetale TaxID=264634 RepID=UPI00047D75E0|nr:hypothetical protein [Acholeplasma equifetale]
MNYKEVLKQRLKSELRYMFLLLSVSLVTIGFLIFDMIMNKEDIGMMIFEIVVILFAALILAYSVYFITFLIFDLKAFKKDKINEITAKFIKYDKRSQVKNGVNIYTYSGQVFKDINTGIEYSIDVKNTEPNKTYIILYGKYSKLGIPIQEIKNKKSEK